MNNRVLVLQLAFLAVFAGSACTASEQIEKNLVMEKTIGTLPLRAGIEHASANSVDDESPAIMFYVENTSEAVESVLMWNTPLEATLSADVLEVTRNGSAVEYLGRTVKRGEPQASDFIEIAAGERVESVLNIAEYYDVSISGIYSVSYKPYPVKGVVQLNQQARANMAQQTLTFTISDQ